MPDFKVSRKARDDLIIMIGRFTQNEWGANQRNICLKQIDDCFNQIAETPEIGVSCDYIRTGYRKFPQGSHIIFYKQNRNSIVEIIRVLHKSMDVSSKLL